MLPLQLSAYNEDDRQYAIYDAMGMSWSTHYGHEGSGFGYLKFSLPRKIGNDYHDIGYGYRVILRKYLNTILFDGQIRQIEEASGPNEDRISITCLGHAIVLDDDEIEWTYCDTRLNKWKMASELAKGSFRPDNFNIGRSSLGLFTHAANGKGLLSGDYTEICYTFPEDDYAVRFKADVSLHLGSGSVFDGQVDSIDTGNGYLFYKNDSGEGQVVANMVVYNYTQAKYATVSSIDTGLDRITVTAPAALGGWASDDEITIAGPLFWAQISVLSDDTITYENDMGEGNLAASQVLANVSKKSIATISSYNTTSNTITVTDEDHITGWELTDVIIVGAPYFEATFSSAASTTITYSSPIGERVASTATGWVLHNVTEDEYATVASWTIASNQLDVTAAGDITGNWTNGDTLRIYTPFRTKVLDGDDTMLWPASDWRQGAVPHNRTAIDVNTASETSQFKVRTECYVAGTADESSFSLFETLKAYSTTLDCTSETLALDLIDLLSMSAHGLSDSTGEIGSIGKLLEPMYFEFKSPTEALAWACNFGDEHGNEVAWGVRLDDRKELFLEAQDKATIGYVVSRAGPISASVSGDLQKSWQQVRGLYTDKLGMQKTTEWQYDQDAYFNDMYRRKSLKIDSVDTEAEAVSVAQLYLESVKSPSASAKYTVSTGSVMTPYGTVVPFDEIVAKGSIVAIEDWRAVEAGSAGTDIRDSWTKEQLVAVEINYDQGTASLTPASARSDFDKYMTELSRSIEGG